MKYLITGSQSLNLINKLNENSNLKLSDAIESIIGQMSKESNLICSIKVFSISEDERDEDETYKYDIHLIINSELLKIYNPEGVQSMVKSISSRVKKIIIDWFPIKEEEIYITKYFKKCDDITT